MHPHREADGRAATRAAPTCVVDPSRPCGACSAPGPWQCPYLYLLDPGELAAIAECGTPAGSRR